MLVHVTLVPVLIVRVAGEKAKLAIFIAVPDVVGVEEFVVEDEPFPDEQAVNKITTDRIRTMVRE